ncbi:MAG: NADP-dependent malic enzyme, partial [Muribaculaceae bacterium]|nr:NADP-dependent malic enzyme [Muribaculaceae bacterium]
INALELQGKNADRIKLVVNGAGAAAIACANLYVALGVRPENIIMCDSKGAITTRRTDLNERKRRFATDAPVTTLADAMAGADVFLGLSVKDVLTPEMIQSMAPNPIVFALANPDPEIEYHKAIASRADLVFATGRSDYPNQINNVLGFPYIFRGALDTRAREINEAMKLAAVYAIAALAKEPVPSVVEKAYGQKGMEFGREYILPKALDPRLLLSVAPAVAKAAISSGVARKEITDWTEYRESLTRVTGFDNKLTRGLIEEAKRFNKRVVFGEGNTDNTLLAAVDARRQGIARPVLLGNAEMIAARANRLGVDLTGIEIVNPRHDDSAPLRQMYAEKLAARRHRQGMTVNEAVELMYDRNYFGMMMVDSGQADAFVAGAYAGSNRLQRLAAEVIGIRDGYSHFASMHAIETKRGTLFLADTATNELTDEKALVDITRLAAANVGKFTNSQPVVALVSYSNFGSSRAPESVKMHNVIDYLHREYPDLLVDGEMQVNYALNTAARDNTFPFNKLAGREVNTLVFPNLSAANTATRLLLEMGVGESIGPIQMGLKRPVHFVKVDAPVRDIVNVVDVAVIDAALSKTE